MKDLFENENDNRRKYQYQIILKRKNLDEKIKQTINLAFILLNEKEISVFKFISIIYDLCETNINNEKSLKKSSFDISKFVEKLLKKSAIFVTNSKLMNEIKKKYQNNDIVQRIITAKIANQIRISYNLTKKK